MTLTTRSLISLPKHMTLCTLIMLLSFFVGCAEMPAENAGPSPWVPATAQIKQSLGVFNWYIETLNDGTTQIIGYDQSDIQLSEMRISTPVLDQVQTLTYELHVTQYTRVVIAESGMIENTLSAEPRGNEWFDAMMYVQSTATTKSVVNKLSFRSFALCVAHEAGFEVGSLACDWTSGSYGRPEDYYRVCMAIHTCLQHQAYNHEDTYYASSNTGNSGYSDTWATSSNTNSTCYDSYGYETPCQNSYQTNQNNVCYDSWGYETPCDLW